MLYIDHVHPYCRFKQRDQVMSSDIFTPIHVTIGGGPNYMPDYYFIGLNRYLNTVL